MESPPYTALRSWAVFAGPLRQALHRLKYARDIALGETLAQPLIELFLSLCWKVDLVVPVPLSRARGVERGYNQAALLARPLAWPAGFLPPKPPKRGPQPGWPDEIRRRDTVKDAFFAPSSQVQGKRILVIDDVTTSGATIEACAQALTAGGAERIYGLTLARAVQEVRP
jgi:ComF family protein